MFERRETATNDNELIQLVSFDLGTEEYGIDILRVQEINRMVEITRIPQTPRFVEGVINLRGKVIPVMDLRTKFGLERKEHDRSSRIVVCDVDGSIVGMVVDAVSEVLRISASTVAMPVASSLAPGTTGFRPISARKAAVIMFRTTPRRSGVRHIQRGRPSARASEPPATVSIAAKGSTTNRFFPQLVASPGGKLSE